MQPVNPYNLAALRFTSDVFELNKQAFNDALTEDVVFDCEAGLVDGESHTIMPPVHIQGKGVVSAVFTQRIFDITTNVILGPVKSKPLDANQVKVKFSSIETKKEETGPKTYSYLGHYILTFIEQEEAGIKVRKIDLKNTRTVIA